MFRKNFLFSGDNLQIYEFNVESFTYLSTTSTAPIPRGNYTILSDRLGYMCNSKFYYGRAHTRETCFTDVYECGSIGMALLNYICGTGYDGQHNI